MDRRIILLPLSLLFTAGVTFAAQAQQAQAQQAQAQQAQAQQAQETTAPKLERGTPIKISGRVLDTSRTPLRSVTVLFEIARRPSSGLFKRRKQQETVDKVSLPTMANEEGSFTIEWPWDPFYDTFSVAVALPIHQGTHRTFEILHRTDLSTALMQAGHAEVELIVEESPGLVWLRRFLDEGVGDDERRIFEELGRPDRYDAPAAEGEKEAWWYFTAGKVYWFKGGSLEQVEHFEPIPPLE